VLEVSRWMQNRSINIFLKCLIFFPMNAYNNHWSLCAIYNLPQLESVLEEGFKDINSPIPFIMHLDSYPGCHDATFLGSYVCSWLLYELTLYKGQEFAPKLANTCPTINPIGKCL
jgi:Ulp1 family protease